MSIGHTMLTHRSEQHADELPMTPAAHDEQVGSLRCLDQQRSGVTLDCSCLDRDAGMRVTYRLEMIAQCGLADAFLVELGIDGRPSIAS